MTIETILEKPDFQSYLKRHCGQLHIRKLAELTAKLNPKTEEDFKPPKLFLAIFGLSAGSAFILGYQPLPGNPPRVKLTGSSNLGNFEQMVELAERNNNGHPTYSFICTCGDKVKRLFLDCDSDQYVCVQCLAKTLTFTTIKTTKVHRRDMVPAY